MEAAGLVLAVANLMDPLIRLGRRASTSWRQSAHFGVDAEKVRVQFRRERRQVEATRQLLLMKAEGLGLGTTIFEQFEDMWQADLLDELRQLKALTQSLEEIEKRYHVFTETHDTQLQGQPPTDEIVRLALDENREADLQRQATKSQLMLWGLKDAKRTAKLLEDLHKWVEFFKEDVKMYLGFCFKTPDKLRILRQNADVAALGLTRAVELREILIRTVDPEGKFHVKSQPQIGTALSETLARGEYEDRPALIEFKSYNPDAETAVLRETQSRVCQLAALLRAPQNPEDGPSLRVLPCAGYFVEPLEKRYCFIYEIPPSLYPEPISLLYTITEGEQKYRSTIKHRFQLAYTLALGIHQLHLVGWVHKSLRSESIIFFPSKDSPLEGDAAPAIPDALIDRRNAECYIEPWLFGFEYSRGISKNSELAATDTSIAKNIYRHPERWNAPTHRFGPIHDIYALGTVLLEIGLWKPLLSLSESGFARVVEPASSKNETVAKDAKGKVQKQFLQNAMKRLPCTLGRAYCDIVQLCLSGVHRGPQGSEGFDVDENAQNASELLIKAFREKVVDRLRDLAAGI